MLYDRDGDREPEDGLSWAERHAAAALGALAAVSLSLAGPGAASAAKATQLSGSTRTIDGDTLEVSAMYQGLGLKRRRPANRYANSATVEPYKLQLKL